MCKEFIIANLEEDWDMEGVYFEVTEEGMIRKYDVINDLVFEYAIQEAAH